MPCLFLGLLAAGLLYIFLARLSLRRFFAPAPASREASPRPGVTIFKPVKGLASLSRECLESFLTQDYQPYQVLFGVADPGDPVLPLLAELKRAHPQVDLEILICPESLGLNPKVSVLRQLEPRARYGVLVFSDGDVRVGPDFLARVVAALGEPGVGLVSCPYRAAPPRTLGARLEALTISGDFIPAVAVGSWVEEIRFALGAAMAVTREALARSGGLAALADFLADDYQLGYRVAQAGFQVRLHPYVVETGNPEMGVREYLARQLRWSRTYRVCRPRGYLAFGITHAFVFSLALLLSGGVSLGSLALLAVTLAARTDLAYFSERRCLQGDLPGAAFLLLPVKDLVAFGLWLASFLGDRVTWQNARFRVTPEGKLRPV